MKKIIFLLLLTSLLISTSLAQANNTEIVVSGRGIIQAEPDVAYIIAGIERTEKTASRAQDIAAQKMNNILDSLAKAGIDKQKIETTELRLSPNYQYENGKRSLNGYSVRNQIKITVDNLAQVGQIIDRMISAGANNVQNISFRIKDDTNYKKSALEKAYADAKEKADTIAKTAGLNIKKIKVIHESEANVVYPTNKIMRSFAAESGSSDTPISPGKIEIIGNLTVIYECN